jgi:sirohydrochlorin cobaltochelatase
LVAHGSTQNASSGEAAYGQAEVLRGRRLFGQVLVAFVQQDPPLAGVWRRVFTPRAYVVPLFISEGWFTREVIPVELGLKEPGVREWARTQEREEGRVHYCGVVGNHPSMTDVLLARARGVVARHPFPRCPKPAETTLIVAGHGTGYSRGSRESIEFQVTALRDCGGYESVHGVFLEEAPWVRDTWSLGAAPNVVLVPFFISDGLHTQEDIPEMLGEPVAAVRERLRQGRPTWRNPTGREGRRLWYAEPLGREPLLAEVILQRVREAAAAV